jgi:hypothetical protein
MMARASMNPQVISAFVAVVTLPSVALSATDPETGRWALGIGDPTVLGWSTVLAYAVAAGLSISNIRRGSISQLHYRIWTFLSAILIALAVNKQLDLQSLFTQVARDWSISQGWYNDRRIFQVIFIATLSAAALGISLAMRKVFSAYWKQYDLVFYGVAALLTFVVIRAATFHHIDILLDVEIGGLNMNFLLEMTGITLVALGSLKWKSMNLHS